ncbi:MAG: hypothetical protein O2782_18795, partial [bacterium]|nr:hypothetical protein [bacterium]
MMPRVPLFLLLLVFSTASVAQIRDLTVLQEQRSRLAQHSDSLMSVRIRLVAQRDSLSARTDTLWSLDPESTELLRARAASRILIARLQFIEGRLDSLATTGDSLEAGLRDAYDWEISRLHGLLNEDGWDEGLYRQLLVFQEEREGLGNAFSPAAHRFDGDQELSIAATDGPEELRQKIEFAQDRIVAAQLAQREIARQQQKIEFAQDRVAALQEEQHEIARQLRFIDRRLLMMRKFRHLATEMMHLRGDDATMLQMRVVERADGPGVEVVHPEAQDMPISAGVQSLASALVDSAGTATPLEAPWLLKAQRLKA